MYHKVVSVECRIPQFLYGKVTEGVKQLEKVTIKILIIIILCTCTCSSKFLRIIALCSHGIMSVL